MGIQLLESGLGLAVNVYCKLSKTNTEENKRRTAITTTATTTDMLRKERKENLIKCIFDECRLSILINLNL